MLPSSLLCAAATDIRDGCHVARLNEYLNLLGSLSWATSITLKRTEPWGTVTLIESLNVLFTPSATV